VKTHLPIERVGLVLVSLVFLVVSSAGELRAQDRSVAELANIQYTALDGTKLYAYLAKPEGFGPHPAVLLIHEWWGLNEDIISKADALAAQGYVVLAADAWRGVNTHSFPHAIWLVTTTPQERVSSDLEASLKYLTVLGDVDPKRLAVMGFCYGGGQSLRFGTRHPELAATILFYGQREPSYGKFIYYETAETFSESAGSTC
jgi:carboxymethylenebutenolidase